LLKPVNSPHQNQFVDNGKETNGVAAAQQFGISVKLSLLADPMPAAQLC
jgi:hypothetical protein